MFETVIAKPRFGWERKLVSLGIVLSAFLAGSQGTMIADPIFGVAIPTGPWGTGVSGMYGNASATAYPSLVDQQLFSEPNGSGPVERGIHDPGTTATAGGSEATFSLDATVNQGAFEIVSEAKVNSSGNSAGGAYGQGTLKWWDTVTLVGPPGQNLSYRLALSNNAFAQGTPGASGEAGLYEELSVDKSFLGLFAIQQLFLCRAFNYGNADVPSCSDSDTGTFTAKSGTTFTLEAALQFQVAASTTAFFGVQNPDFKISDQQDFQILLTPLTPGASFTDASGATYSLGSPTTTVPEPASLALFGSGLLLLTGFLHRKSGGKANR